MATGGTIPSNRTQTVTFYNTSGVIEKDKLIYLAPRFKTMTGLVVGSEVRSVFLSALNGVCPPSSAYKDIAISGWSPQDRTLVVKGNIDDFRLVTEEGDCLNYFVVTRNVVKGEGQQAVTKTYYYGFFITGVEQAGGSSVKLTAEPDDFTNVFYLHNKHVLTQAEVNAEYEPFNERMKNCHVNRQHYNRVTITIQDYTLKIKLRDIHQNPDFVVGQPVTVSFADSVQGTEVTGTVEYFDDRNFDSESIIILYVKTSSRLTIGKPDNYSTLYYNSNQYSFDYQAQENEWVTNYTQSLVNLNIFLNQEESYKYRYQYRDSRKPFSFSDVFTEDEMATIQSTNNFNNLSETLRKKIILASIQYLMVEMKSSEKFTEVGTHDTTMPGSPIVWLDFEGKQYVEDFYKSSPVIHSPLFNVPEFLSKYESAITNFKFYYTLKVSAGATCPEWQIPDGSAVYSIINKNALADFVYSAYVVNDICIPDEFINIDLSNNKVIYKTVLGTWSTVTKNTLYFVPVSRNESTQVPPEHIGYYYDYGAGGSIIQRDILSNIGGIFEFGALMLSGYNSRKFEINMNYQVPNLKSNYYDTVLESEPYSFYSLSFLTYEMPFNRNRYYETNKLECDYFLSINGAIKISFIPTYQVESKKYKYFNEGLVFTLPSSLPLVSDSYNQYYYQNKAQMKNQFAVNDYNRGVDLAQHFFLSGPNAVGQSAFKRGGWGAISETVNQFAQMGDEIIDWGQSNKVIEMNQKAKLADMGAKPDNVKQTGSDVFSDLLTRENRPYLNHYTIDERSYISIAKFLERFGYQVNLYDNVHAMDRVGWNYVKLNSFDWYGAELMNEQEENIKKMFYQGVTLLHNKTYLTTGHNYETILDN